MAIEGERIGRRRSAGGAFGALLVGAATAVALAGLLGLRLEVVLSGRSGVWRVDSAVEACVLVVGGLVALWLAVSASVAAVCVLARVAGASWEAGESLVARCAPRVVRIALVVVVGAGVGLGLASGASAASPAPAPSASVGVVAGADDLGWAVTGPDVASGPAEGSGPVAAATDAPFPQAEQLAPTGAGTPAGQPAAASAPALAMETQATPTTPTTPTTADTVVVVAGDSLWAIAARHLPPESTDAQIAEAWPQWYDANTATIGADPGRILPGQVLAVPTTGAGMSS